MSAIDSASGPPESRRTESAVYGGDNRPAWSAEARASRIDGKLLDRACKRLGLSAAGLAASSGAHQSVLSRARHGELPKAHREAILALLSAEAG